MPIVVTLNVNIFLSPDLVDGSREAKNQNVFLLKVRRSSSKRKDKENGGSEGGKNGGHVSVNNIMNVAELCVRWHYICDCVAGRSSFEKAKQRWFWRSCSRASKPVEGSQLGQPKGNLVHLETTWFTWFTWFTLRPPDCETAGSTQPWKFFWPGEWQSASFSSWADTEGDAQNLDLQDLEPSDQLACHTLSSMESKDPNLTRALLALNQVQLQPTLFRLQAPTLPDQNVLTALLHLSFLDGSTLKRGHQPNEHLCQQTQTHWMQTHNVQTNLYVQLSQFCE